MTNRIYQVPRLFLLSCLLFFAWLPVAYSQDGRLEAHIREEFQLLETSDSRPPYDLFERGMIGYYCLIAKGEVLQNSKLTLIDFRLSSNVRRMWVIDLSSRRVLFNVLVAHGRNTGEEYAQHFSNNKNSNQSSLGFYRTGEMYIGKHGLSLRLDGLEPGINDNARIRSIVIHGASYVSEDFIQQYGRLGRSFGCPAVSLSDHKKIIKTLTNKSLLFIYAVGETYDQNSRYSDRASALTGMDRTKSTE